MNKPQERDIPKIIGRTKSAELILEFNETRNDYTVAVRKFHEDDPVYIYTQRGSLKSFKSIHRGISWGEKYNFSKATVTHTYNRK